MTLAGVGIDLEPVARFRRGGPGASEAFRRRVLTPGESRRCRGDAAAVARCFTAKEAVAKALGVGLSLGEAPGVRCLDIEVAGRGGRVRLRGRALALARARGWGPDAVRVAWEGAGGSDGSRVCAVAAVAAGGSPGRALARIREALVRALRA